jgi:hypothetical protein
VSSLIRTLVCTAACGLPALAHAQTQGLPAAAQRSFTELRARVAHGTGGESQRVQIQWFVENRAETTAAAPPLREARVLERRRGLGALPFERDPQLSTDHLVVVSIDKVGRELDWRTVSDPRLIRAEVPDATGQLHGQTLTRRQADLLVDIPDDPDITGLRVYEVQWAGGEFILKLVATASLE